ncbi:Sialic acid TRAP transporter permease protein SiaT [Roseovarius albus]|uniref:TRAP transporter large permease protein n=1 Tax=Roseovarius albus TaxID=1247867 RepID=A0A1X6Z4G1_9RHOB|nr:TRAP transporter large permease [Roseovarius albus]SLN38495.1 Sialic acid TRAP transporter permease protein SiaT [Roseovarius albus]
MILTMLVVMLIHVILGLPLFLSLMATAIVGFSFVGFDQMARIMPQQAFGGIDVFSLMAIPLFILAGNLMNNGQMTPRLLALADRLVGHLRGGLGHVNVTASVFFAGVNGSAVADTSALGTLLIPGMRKAGFPGTYAAGLTAASSLIGPIVPPSIFMILYASITGTSVGSLFLGGVLPGIALGLAFMGMNVIYARVYNVEKNQRRANLREIACSAYNALPALIAPVIIVAGIVMGVVTPTESGALTVAYVLIWGFWSKNLSLQNAWLSLRETAILTSAVFVIIAISSIVSWQLAYANAPEAFVGLLEPFANSPALTLIAISCVTFITGMFMEEVSALFLLTPIILPVAQIAGVDPVHLGIVMTLNITIALITPPLGACIFVAAAVGKVDITRLFVAIWPFIAVAMGVLLIIILVPGLTTWLPSRLM